jgi:tetratricopeptide (TPR) repeat protein
MELPSEVWIHIFLKLPNINDLISVARACKYFNTLSSEERLWRSLCLQDFGPTELASSNIRNKYIGLYCKEKGNYYWVKENHNKALWFCSKGLSADPSSYLLWSNRSAVHAKLQHFEDAVFDAEKVIELNPSWPKGYSRKGFALFKLRKFEEAKQAYSKGMQLAPQDANLYTAFEKVRWKENYLADVKRRVEHTGKLQEFKKGKKKIPFFIFEESICTHLRELVIEGNHIRTLSPEIGKLKSLEVLNLAWNEVASIPNEIGGLGKLHKLCLEGNFLTEVAPEIGLLTGLRDLWLYDNKLTTLPVELANLTNLLSLRVEGNALRFPPQDICEQGRIAILDYLRKAIVPVEGVPTLPQEQLPKEEDKTTVDCQPESWTVEQVCEWLKKRNFREGIVSMCKEELVDGEVLLSLTEEDMLKLGISAFGERRKLNLAITELKQARGHM